MITCIFPLSHNPPSDVQAPTFRCPSSMSVFSEPKLQPKVVTWPQPIATDNSGESVSVMSSHQSGDLFSLGLTTVTFEASDSSGNTRRCTTDVDVQGNSST